MRSAMDWRSEGYSDDLLRELEEVFRRQQRDVVAVICCRLKAVGELNPTSARQLANLAKWQRADLAEIKRLIKKYSGLSAAEVENAFEAAGDKSNAARERRRARELGREYRQFSEAVGLSVKENRLRTHRGKSELEKGVKIPDDFLAGQEIPQDIKDAIVENINEVSGKYNVRIDEMTYRSLKPHEGKVPFQFVPINDSGKLKMQLAINKGFNWNESLDAFNERIYNKNYSTGILASRNITGLIYHEMVHFMSFQDCETWSDFLTAERNLRRQFVAGISRYADATMDGAESLAEAFVKQLNGDVIPKAAEELISEYIERCRK